ncbi:HNH endonuclease signature motif containing protein [Nocardioides sp. SYSU D00065]|uniref:HNH endonuclease n=1 Tax=Nocardioides sp. SYSU D00065 TaxID=2817378 RepID=UPI001B33E24C|nr:HNH endonuclease signature motif containing protein [Nocardioides sp. SYSU D00065]
MFDVETPLVGTQPCVPPVLGASSVRGWKDAVAASLAAPSDLSDADRVESIRALEELVCVATAAQAQLTRELDASQRAEQAAAGVRAAQRGRGVAHQVALARREAPHRAQRHLGLAAVVADELPHTWAAWRAGRITEWKATLVARETACLNVEHRLEVDREVAADAGRLERMGDRELAAACASWAARIDPASVTARRRRAESERGVTLRAAPDTMTYLTALLPVKDGVAAYAVLAARAASARAAGDERSRGQVMADELVAALRRPPDDADRGAAAPRVELGLVMTDAALLGGADDPAHIEDFGPIPAELAREIVAGACTGDEEVWLRRLYASPTTGELVSMDVRGRFFRGSLARFVKLRDRTCRTPWCDAPVRHIDHVRPRADGGPTGGPNGQGLCESCNYAKDAPRWRSRPQPDGSIETATPTGQRYRTRPPPVATIRRRSLPALTIDYVLMA